MEINECNQVEPRQILGLRFNVEQKAIEMAVKCEEICLEVPMKIEEALEFQKALGMVIQEAQASNQAEKEIDSKDEIAELGEK